MATVGLALVVALAAWFRQFLDNSGIPGFTFARHDEIHYVDQVLRFLHGQWEVSYFINPTFYSYVLYAATSLYGGLLVAVGAFESWSEFVLSVTLEPFLVTMTGRTMSCLCSVASVVALYGLAQKLMPARSALLAPAALAVCFTHAHRAVLAGNESLLVLLVLLFFLALFAYLEKPTTARHLLCGLLLGLGFSTKYNAAIAAPALVIATGQVAARIRPPGVGWVRHLAGSRFLAGFAATPIAFVATSPQALIRAGEFWHDFRTQSRYLHAGWTDVEAANPQRGWLRYLMEFPDATTGLPFAVLCGVGILLATGVVVRRRDPRLLVLLATILLLYLFLGSGIFVRSRFLLPVIPLVLLLGAWALDRLVRLPLRRHPRLSQHVWLATLGLGALLLAPAAPGSFNTLREEYGALDPRSELLRWTRENLEPDDAYLQFATMPRLRILETRRRRLGRYGVREADLGSEAERNRVRRFLDHTPRVSNLEVLLANSPDHDAFETKVREGGYRKLLIITPARLFDDLDELPRVIHSPSVRQCDYWSELVAELDESQPAPVIVGKGAARMRVYDLPL